MNPPPAEHWEIEIRSFSSPTGPVLALAGELDAHTVGALEGMVRSAGSEETAVLTLDLAGVRFVDSAAARRLARLWVDRHRTGEPLLVLRRVGRRLQRVFELLGLDFVLQDRSRSALEGAPGSSPRGLPGAPAQEGTASPDPGPR